ncbi:hypothetical protein HV454_16850 [Bacillus sporothermodurans]|nr:hypothetical protein [Heyndrickxia sporothermodurans]MBL5769290.1 hypothetical protein [Heyndrickxia sporothermodurans]MBL5787164.1 hypothetical protein [Heyndrickxia sporothermodurans]MBL5851825.1 hypothetical protein [Heyndrickxia sporothermodurans]MBL5878584.1 hypothetical protein [Heyndrickxia sporothermodurans]MBL5910304.1 hypothetical protein [Heyndrickxia sporothermodurans]
MAFGQIGHLFGYGSIYKTAAVSVIISIILYLIILRKEKSLSSKINTLKGN